MSKYRYITVKGRPIKVPCTKPIEANFEWISVKDRLPEKNTWVLCYVKWMIPVFEMERGIRKYSDVKKVFFDGRFRLGDSVTHWMPLPEPPESEDE